MTDEARLEPTPAGLDRTTPGWFIVNVRDTAWFRSDDFGSACQFEGQHRFEQVGVNVHVMMPGQPGCNYHRENQEEHFLVLSGECLAIVEGAERRLRQWDFFHSPKGTNHVLVGAGDGPCAVLMMGARQGTQELCYPVDATAARYGASVQTETHDPRIAYADRQPRKPAVAPTPYGDVSPDANGVG